MIHFNQGNRPSIHRPRIPLRPGSEIETDIATYTNGSTNGTSGTDFETGNLEISDLSDSENGQEYEGQTFDEALAYCSKLGQGKIYQEPFIDYSL